MLLRMTVDFHLKANVTTWSSVINACTYGVCVCGCVRWGGLLAGCYHLFTRPTRCPDPTIPNDRPTDATRGDFEGAESVLMRMQESRCEPNVTSWSSGPSCVVVAHGLT